MNTTVVQQKIKDAMGRLNWSHNKLVKEYDRSRGYKSQLTVASFKKQLSRDSTNAKLLKTYLDFIESHDDFRRLGLIKPIHTSKDQFEDEFNLEMKGISKRIEDIIKKG
jgi:hypothetical protein